MYTVLSSNIVCKSYSLAHTKVFVFVNFAKFRWTQNKTLNYHKTIYTKVK